MELTGPAAGHALLQTAADPTGRQVLGTFNNCANGKTPWGTYLTCEENFNGYFGTSAAGFAPTALMARYGVMAAAFNPWHIADPRFDLAVNPNEPNRHGWVVEIDPFDATSTPKKRTALGRLKHENAGFAEAADGRAVVYTGDDERFQFLYKFVSTAPWRKVRRGASPLDEGTLFVARFDADGSGAWLPLVEGAVPGTARWPRSSSMPAVPRSAVGATPMDRPEWVAVHPQQAGVAYGTFTNNTNRTTTDAANPRANNRFGHILRWQNAGGDHGATTFIWSVFALAGAGLGTGDGSTIAPVRRVRITRRSGLRPGRSAVDRDRRLAADRVQQPDARRRPGDGRRPPLPRGPEGLRDHRLDDHRGPADDVRERPAPRRECHRPGCSGGAVELARLPGPASLGDRGHPTSRRRQDRHLTRPPAGGAPILDPPRPPTQKLRASVSTRPGSVSAPRSSAVLDADAEAGDPPDTPSPRPRPTRRRPHRPSAGRCGRAVRGDRQPTSASSTFILAARRAGITAANAPATPAIPATTARLPIGTVRVSIP